MKFKPVKHIEVKKGMKISDLVQEMQKSGVMGAGKIGEAARILEKMFQDKECRIFLGIAGAMVPGGMKKIISDILRSGRISAFVTTGANLTHDLVEALGEQHYQGNEEMDDAKLEKEGYVRMFNSLMKNDVYVKLEKFFEENWDVIAKSKNIKEFLWSLGSRVSSSDSILQLCWEKKIPIFCPGIADSGIGLMVWGRIAQGKKKEIHVDVFDDMKEIIDLAWTAEKSGVLYCGGGLPKNFIQQSLQFSKGAHYGVQITTDRPEPGGSSGAPLGEGVSWGKMEEVGEYVDVFCDTTIALPLLWGYVKDKF